MLAASLLAISIAAPPAAAAPSAQRSAPSLMRQADTYAKVEASTAVAPARTQRSKSKDHKWDGALAGALAGAGVGFLTSVAIYGKGDGEWPEFHVIAAGCAFWGAIIGGTTGLVIDSIRR